MEKSAISYLKESKYGDIVFNSISLLTFMKLSDKSIMTSMNFPTLPYDHVTNSFLLEICFWGPTYPTFLYDVTLFSLFFIWTLPLGICILAAVNQQEKGHMQFAKVHMPMHVPMYFVLRNWSVLTDKSVLTDWSILTDWSFLTDWSLLTD